jgi:DNA modification methylase
MDIPLSLSLPWRIENAAPDFLEDSDKFAESLPRYFIEKFTKKDARIFDPFMGLGTTAFVAEELGRIPYGIEHDETRCEWSAGQLEHWMNIKCDDAAQMDKLGFPKMDFCVTSPPYMPKHHKWNPLYSGDPEKEGYDCYLKRTAYIFKKLSSIMKRNSYTVVHVDNLKQGPYYTPLVRDMGLAIEKSMTLKAEIIVNWDNAKPDYPHTHCLVFKNG